MAERFSADIGVVGAGVIGASIALRLAAAGRAVVMFAHPAGARACSLGNAAHIATEQTAPLAAPATIARLPKMLFSSAAPLSVRAAHLPAFLPFALRFARASTPRRFAKGRAALADLMADAITALEELAALAGPDGAIVKSGHYAVAETDADLAELERQLIDRAAAPAEMIDAAARARLENVFGRSFAAAARFTETACVKDPAAFTHALAEAAGANGAARETAEIVGVTAEADGYRIQSADGRTWRVARVIIAAGVWSRQFAAKLGDRLPLEAERGYHLRVADAPAFAGEVGAPVVSVARNIIASPIDGGLQTSGFVEFGGVAAPPTKRLLDRLGADMDAFVPALHGRMRTPWMGFRPTLPDYLPAIGPSKRRPGLYYACGHQHLGLTLAGVTARILESLLETGRSPHELEPFAPGRFE